MPEIIDSPETINITPTDDFVISTNGVERARIHKDGTGSGMFSGSLTASGDVTITPGTSGTGSLKITAVDTAHKAIVLHAPGGAIEIDQTTNWAGVAQDVIDINYQSSGDGVYVCNRGGVPSGFGGSPGGGSSFNTLVPYNQDYDWTNTNIWSGSTPNAGTGMYGLTIIQAVPNNGCGGANIVNFGNDYAVKVSAQTGGGHTSTPVGTGGGILVNDASTATSIRALKSTAPNSGDAICYLQETLGSVMPGILVLDSSGHQNFRVKTDGSHAAQSLFLGTSTSSYAATNRILDVSGMTLGDISGGNAWQLLVVDPTIAPVSDVSKSPVGARIKLTISDASTSAGLTGAYEAISASGISTSATQAVSTVIGVAAVAQNNGAARVSDARALSGQITASLGVMTTGAALFAGSPSIGSGTIDSAYGLHIQNQGSGSATTAIGILIDAQSGSATSRSMKILGGLIELADGVNIFLNNTTGSKIGTAGGASGQKLGFWGATPVVQPLLATGASHTVDDVITVLQTLGLVRQS